MAGDDISGILDAGVSFPKGFKEVSEYARHMHEGGHDEHMHQRKFYHPGPDKDVRRQQDSEPAAHKARPGLLGRYVRAHLGRPDFPAQQQAEAIGAHVRRPDNDEEGEHEQAAVAFRRTYHKGRKRHGQADIDQGGEDIGAVLEVLVHNHHSCHKAYKQERNHAQHSFGNGNRSQVKKDQAEGNDSQSDG